MSSRSQRAFHMLTEDMKSTNGRLGPWKVGMTRRIKQGEGRHLIELCGHGFHSCPTLGDQMGYLYGPMLCLVEISKPVDIEHSDAHIKQVSARRTLLAAWDVTKQIEQWGMNCVDHMVDEARKKAARNYYYDLKTANWGAIDRAQAMAMEGKNCAYLHGIVTPTPNSGSMIVGGYQAGRIEVEWQKQEFTRLMLPVVNSYVEGRTC